MSKNLGNIPAQKKMSEEQEQTFTNGINKGRKLEREEMKKKKKKIYKEFTVEEFDKFALDQKVAGANLERGNIIAELERCSNQLMDFANGLENTKDKNIYARYAYGLKMSISVIEALPGLEDNIGCRECGAF